MKGMAKKVMVIMSTSVLLSLVCPLSWAVEPECPCLWSFFNQSLHFTGNGMRYWYEEPNGFMSITNIPYNSLDCKTCHVKSCDKCHARQNGPAMEFSAEKTQDMKTCMQCHTREALTFKFCENAGNLDVHIASDFVCADCHYQCDVHGDGRFKPSMRHPFPKGVCASCKGCHVDQKRESPIFNSDTPSHSAHGEKLNCAACHVNYTMACYNCHFDSALETGKKGNFIPMYDWLLLINYDGQVTSGSAMTLVYQNKKFIAYCPYFTHCISAQGRSCKQCHQNKAVREMAKGNKIPVVDFKDGKVVTWKGVVPVVPDKLEWVYLNKIGKDKWVPIEDGKDAKVQFAAYGKPLTKKQFEKLAMDVE
ncbi:MAG: hypothetical protein SWQ30_11025 [Thermodesulfobacteriota bacterium]|nr:hypothetical protein [Thermodesulfobacteriota bacterium]